MKQYPIADDVVDGRVVREGPVDNMSSIAASLYEWEILDGIRVVDFLSFEQTELSFYSVQERVRTEKLAAEIRLSKEISPLIVVVDDIGPYILEGCHRFDALTMLGAMAFPAVVVIDREKVPEETTKAVPLWRKEWGLHDASHNLYSDVFFERR